MLRLREEEARGGVFDRKGRAAAIFDINPVVGFWLLDRWAWCLTVEGGVIAGEFSDGLCLETSRLRDWAFVVASAVDLFKGAGGGKVHGPGIPSRLEQSWSTKVAVSSTDGLFSGLVEYKYGCWREVDDVVGCPRGLAAARFLFNTLVRSAAALANSRSRMSLKSFCSTSWGIEPCRSSSSTTLLSKRTNCPSAVNQHEPAVQMKPPS